MAAKATPTLMNLPPPPSDPVTPSELPGTPNSSTTTMSELSTVAIKDGHRGHHAHHGRTNHPDAERADRISRLAGLERVARNSSPHSSSPNLTPGMIPSAGTAPYAQGMTATAAPNNTNSLQQAATAPTHAGYFYIDPASGAQVAAANRERSTVGSASATGSLAGRTTWASMSANADEASLDTDTDAGISDTVSSVNARDANDAGSSVGLPDRDRDQMDTSSVGGFSDEASLVGFGEGARTPARHSAALTANSMQSGYNNNVAVAMGKPGGSSSDPNLQHGGGSGTNSSTALSGSANER